MSQQQYKMSFTIEEELLKATESTTYMQSEVNKIIEKCGYKVLENSCLFHKS